MDLNFGDLLSEGLNNLNINLEDLYTECDTSLNDYIEFTRLLFFTKQESEIPDKEVTLDEFMENNFLSNYLQALKNAAYNYTSDDKYINTISKRISNLVNNGYLIKDIPDAKEDKIPSRIINNNGFF